MPAPRRLPLATLARASGARRRGGKGRLALVTLALTAAVVAAVWYFRFRSSTDDTLPPIDEAVPDASPLAAATPDALPAQDVSAAPEPAPLTFGATLAPDAAAATTAPGPPTGPVLSKPTPPGTPVPEAPAPVPPPAVGPVESDFRPRLPRDVFEAQVALMRDAICPGSIDGAWGGQTRAAVAAFQEKHGLRVTGQLDNATRDALQLQRQPLRHYVVTEEDIARLRPFPKGWLQKSELDSMGYATVLEAIAERTCTNPKQITRLNPQVAWASIKAGTVLVVPDIGRRATPSTRPEYILISLGEKTLRLYDATNNLLAHFPCSIARRVEKRPVGELSVLTVAPNPNYTFNPETFPDSPDAQKVGRKLILQPGPNNPVGIAWIALSAGDGSYGIHGSPEPEQIGRTESSGCFRLANWNAEYLVPLVRAGMLVRVEP
ncbi:MAG: murein L,D-transpeptidase [Opitutaceae bacterium]|nr:murein L,D-transpeptidase [Opitutaceae bacterium]